MNPFRDNIGISHSLIPNRDLFRWFATLLFSLAYIRSSRRSNDISACNPWFNLFNSFLLLYLLLPVILNQRISSFFSRYITTMACLSLFCQGIFNLFLSRNNAFCLFPLLKISFLFCFLASFFKGLKSFSP